MAVPAMLGSAVSAASVAYPRYLAPLLLLSSFVIR